MNIKAKQVLNYTPLRRVNKDIELITELILRNDAKDAPQKTEYNGKWYQSIIPVGKDHVAYLTFDDDAFQTMRKVWEEAQTNGEKITDITRKGIS